MNEWRFEKHKNVVMKRLEAKGIQQGGMAKCCEASQGIQWTVALYEEEEKGEYPQVSFKGVITYATLCVGTNKI